jgi:hypothetical protein
VPNTLEVTVTLWPSMGRPLHPTEEAEMRTYDSARRVAEAAVRHPVTLNFSEQVVGVVESTSLDARGEVTAKVVVDLDALPEQLRAVLTGAEPRFVPHVSATKTGKPKLEAVQLRFGA